MHHFFPNGWLPYLAGGIFIGLGVSLLFALAGFIGGVSTIFTAICSFFSKGQHFQKERFITTRNWRISYALGMVLGGIVFTFLLNGGRSFVTHVPAWQLFVGGVLGGFGARVSGGCTSGHGICGLGSLQIPSLLAVFTFICTAIITAHLVHMFGGY